MPPVDLADLAMPQPALAALQNLLARHVPAAQVWAHGSRVRGGAHDGSDLDIVLRHPTDRASDIAGWQDLQEAVQHSNIPIMVDIHLWSHLPASFHREIEQRYVVLQNGRVDG